jgi:hypothetical protein
MSCSSALSDVLNTELFHSQPLTLEVCCPCTGKVFLERARQAAGSAAAAVAAAVASGLQSVPDSSPFRGLESGIGSGLPAAVETQILQRVAHPISPESKMHPCSRLPR